MKPRHISAPLTSEDFDIWDDLSEPGTVAFPDGVPLWGYQQSDRRDADLMFWLTRFGARHWATWKAQKPPHFMAIAHTFMQMDPEWPHGHIGIEL